MAVVNERAVVSVFDMLERPVIRLPKVLGGLTFDQQIQKLFATGEQGFFYDPNDLSTMYQDAAGTVPVTAAGQPVGLILDKSKLSEQTVVKDVKFADGLGGFNVGSSQVEPTHTMKLVNGLLDIRLDTPTPLVTLSLPNVGVVGDWVHITVDCAEYTSGSLKADGLIATPIVNKAGINSSIFQLTSTTLPIYRQGVPAIMKLRGIKIVNLGGNHAFQTTSASRPILRQNAVTGANYLEFDGTDDCLQTSNIDFTATDKVSLFAGVRKMPATAVNMLCELSSSSTAENQANAFYLAVPETPSGTVYFRSRTTILIGQVARAESGIGMRNCVITAKSDIPNGLNTVSIDGVLGTPFIGSLGAGKLGNYPLYIGSRGGTTFPFNGHLYGLIGIGKLVSDNETLAIEKELAKRVGVALNV